MPKKRPVPRVDAYVNDGGWTRKRVAFLSVSGVLFVGMLSIGRAVLLPFLLGLVLAYVLTPLVAFLEKRRLPRSLSILGVYAIVLFSLYQSVALGAPRIVRETVGIARELPRIIEDVGHTIGPRVDGFLQKLAPREVVESARHPSAFEVRPLPSGGFSVDVGSGITITGDDSNRFRIESTNPDAAQGFEFTRALEGVTGEFLAYAKKNAVELLKLGQRIVMSTSHAIFLLFMTLMVGGFLMYTREAVVGFFRGLVPWQARGSFDQLLFRLDRGLSGVVRGQLLICLVNGVLSAVGFWMLGLKYWPLMSLIAAVGSLIPIFGSVLAAVPAVAIGLTDGFFTGLWVLIWILGIHQLEANLLNPKIIGTAARIHPVLVVFVLLVGEHLFGLWGALFAVPTWSIAQSIFLHFRAQVVPDAGDTILPLFVPKQPDPVAQEPALDPK